MVYHVFRLKEQISFKCGAWNRWRTTNVLFPRKTEYRQGGTPSPTGMDGCRRLPLSQICFYGQFVKIAVPRTRGLPGFSCLDDNHQRYGRWLWKENNSTGRWTMTKIISLPKFKKNLPFTYKVARVVLPGSTSIEASNGLPISYKVAHKKFR